MKSLLAHVLLFVCLVFSVACKERADTVEAKADSVGLLDLEAILGEWAGQGIEGSQVVYSMKITKGDRGGEFSFSAKSAMHRTVYSGLIREVKDGFQADVVLGPVVEGASRQWNIDRRVDGNHEQLLVETAPDRRIVLERPHRKK